MVGSQPIWSPQWGDILRSSYHHLNHLPTSRMNHPVDLLFPSWSFLDPVQNCPVVWSQMTDNLTDGVHGKETQQESGGKDCPETGGMLGRLQTSFPSTPAGRFRWRVVMFSGVWGASSPKNDLPLHRGRLCLLAGPFTSGLK